MPDEIIMPPMLDVSWDGGAILVEARLPLKRDIDRLIHALTEMRDLLPDEQPDTGQE